MKRTANVIQLILVFLFTFLTCSGCFKSSSKRPSSYTSGGPVGIISVPSTTTVRMMNEALYAGYLGAQRDFALLVDNSSYTYDNNIQGCKSDERIGCASLLAKLVMNYGISTASFNNTSSSENILIYYTNSKDFDSYGGNKDGQSWYEYLTDKAFEKSGLSEVRDLIKGLDSITIHSCGTKYNDLTDEELKNGEERKFKACDYSKDLSKKGYSDSIGNAMLLLFKDGEFHSMITDKDLDPNGNYNNRSGNRNLDNLSYEGSAEEYYNYLVTRLKTRIHVSNTYNLTSTSEGTVRDIHELKSIQELINLVNNTAIGDYLLLITSDGFINEKVGYQYQYNKDDTPIDTAGGDESPSTKAAILLVNSLTSYTDNCSYEGDEAFVNFLKAVLRYAVAGGAGALVGAGGGALAGALIGSIIPGVGTLVGMGVGALAGAIAGLFAGITAEKALEEEMQDANGISDKNYCRIVKGALDQVKINVPIYTYNIKTAQNNIKRYNDNNLDTKIREYYNQNSDKCLNQYAKVSVPSGLLSFFTSNVDKKYEYADTCEAELVSDIVGGFDGSPSLLLYLNNRQVDDLNGRVTTDLVKEMLIVWGLESVGDLYTIGFSNKINGFKVQLGSAKKISEMTYCLSESQWGWGQCYQNSPQAAVSLENNNYVGASTSANAITIDFLNLYKQYSNTRLKEIFTTKRVNALNISNFNLNNYQYLKKAISASEWGKMVYVAPTEENPDTELGTIINSIKAGYANNNSNLYEFKYNDVNYLVIGNDIIGYKFTDEEELVIVYYRNSQNEYLFDGIESDKASDYYIYANKDEMIKKAYDDIYSYVRYRFEDASIYSYYTYII